MTTTRGPRAPAYLSAKARKWWRQIASDYELEEHHRTLLTLAAEALDRVEEAKQIIKREGLVVKDRYGKPKAHPAVAIERDSRMAFVRTLRELDLDAEAPPDIRPPNLRRYR